MAQVDLHLHTTYSDGTLSPEALVAEAAARGVRVIAVTDHDEVGGVAPARKAAEACGVEVWSGVEINTQVGRNEVHILGYGFSVDSAVLAEGLAYLRQGRIERMERILQRLADLGYPLDVERVRQLAGHGSVGRPHIARALVEAGYVKSMGDAFDRLIGDRGPAYVPRMKYLPEEAIELIHRAGGFASLAHPGKLGDPPAMIRRLLPAGLDALEAYHSDHLPATAERMLRQARNYRLAVTGGTDSHGPGGAHEVPIGSVEMPDTIVEPLRKLIAGRMKEKRGL
ncbi:MAG: PHP domain-containing protein [Armatimonadota bacterium]